MASLALSTSPILIALLAFLRATGAWPALQSAVPLPPWAGDHGHNELYVPTPSHIIPMKKPLQFDAKMHYYEHHHNNELNGTYKRASCPALNTLANRGFIPRTGRNVTYQSMAQSMRNVFNFGDDNVGDVGITFNDSPGNVLCRLCWSLFRLLPFTQAPRPLTSINSWYDPAIAVLVNPIG